MVGDSLLLTEAILSTLRGEPGLLPSEKLVLDALNIEPTDVQRNKPIKPFDVNFNYEEATGVGIRRAGAWMPLLLIKRVYETFPNAVRRMAEQYGPQVEGDWSFIRDLDREDIWSLFRDVTNQFYATPIDAARFAHAKE